MPSQPQWLLRLPEILEEVRALPRPVLDRPAIEKLFRLKRRQAITLLGFFGGYQTGKTFLVERQQLLDQLEGLAQGAAYVGAARRRERLDRELDAARKIAHARKIKIPAPPDVRDRLLDDLPAGIHLRPGELRIEFFGTEDLLRMLFELSQAILNDYSRFQKAVEPS